MTAPRLLVALALAAAVFGAVVRFTDLGDVFCQSPDELAEIMPGVRLHALPLGNIGAPVRYNFVRSMFYSQHGLGDVSFYYLASGLLSLVRLPVSERNLYAAGGVANLGLAIAGGVVGAWLLGSTATGLIFATLVFVSPFYTFVSKTGWARLTWTPLLLLLVFLAQRKAMQDRRVLWAAISAALAGFIALTDGFTMLPVLPVLGLLSVNGRPIDRLRRLLRDRIFLTGMAAAALGIAVDLLVGLGARRRGTDLTMMAYVLLRGGHGALLPSWTTLTAWTLCVDRYFPFRGAWLFVTAAFVLAARDGLRGRMVGFVAAWWLLASAALLRDAAGVMTTDIRTAPGWLNAYQLAVPSLLLMAWLIASAGDGRFAPTPRVPPPVRGAVAFTLLVALVVFLARQSVVVAFGSENRYGLRIEDLVHHTETPLSGCRAVKAAAFYIRSHQTDVPYVFHLTADVYLGHIAEFYDGLSYGRSSRPEDPNRLLDFGLHQTGRRNPPEAFYRPYGIRHFDYYVEFADDRDPFTTETANRLLAEGARVVCTIADAGRPIARILSFRDEVPADLDYRAAAAAWDRRFGRAATLLQQPLAGTAYHFGYNWKTVGTIVSASAAPAPDLSIVIPALNQASELESLLPALLSVTLALRIQADVIVVDGGSTDRTAESARRLGARVLRQPSSAYGLALLGGFAAAARAPFIVTLDADVSDPGPVLRDLWAARERAALVVASRYVAGGASRTAWTRRVLSRVLNALCSRVLSVPIRDLTSGCRLYRRLVLESLPATSTDFAVLPEIVVRLYAEGYPVVEVPFQFTSRGAGRPRGQLLRLGWSYVRTLFRLWQLRNSILSADYDHRAFDSVIPLQRTWQRARHRIVLDFAAPGGRTLDVGCGSSRILRDLPGAVGVDVLLRKLRFLHTAHPEVVQASVFALPFADAAFDIVICSEVIEHVPDEPKVLGELTRVLAPGGTLVLGTPDYGRWLWHVIEWIYGRVAPGAYAHEHITHFDRAGLQARLKSLGYTLLDCQYVGACEMILKARKAG